MLKSIKLLGIACIALACGSGGEQAKEAASAPESKPAPTAAASTDGNAANGKNLYMTCVACHGENGQGNKMLNAPTIANQEPWYLERQINNFRNGLRGYKPEDTNGAQMTAMAKTLGSDDQVKDVVAYIATLAPVTVASTITGGDAEKGKLSYQICAACHGANAEGNKTLNAPRLTGVDDWYLIDQYKKYGNELRGSHPEDTFGAQMKAMSTTLNDEDLKNVMAYIQTLN
ncbi:MAG: c-type cytochrome [Cyclobacteriaceae bacterium]